MKAKNILTIFILSFCYLTTAAQTSLVPDEKMEEEMRELIRDSVIYDCFISGVNLDRALKNGSISEKDHAIQKNELLRIKAERKKTKNNERTLVAGVAIAEGGETTLAVNPSNPNEVVAGFIINNVIAGGCAVYYSADGGLTWNQSAFDPQAMIMATIPGVTSVDGGGDPSITVDKNGVFYFTWIGIYTTATGNFYSTLYATSSNGGASFTAPALSDFIITEYNQNLGFGFFDRIWINADITSGSTAGTVYLNGSVFDFADMSQIVYVKPPGSTTFSLSPNPCIPALPDHNASVGNIEVGDNGVVHTCALLYDIYDANTNGQISYSRSVDQGATWSTPIYMANAPFGGSGGLIFNDENAALSLGVDSNTVYLAWSNMYPSPKVYYVVSTDDGLTWSSPINIGSAICPGPYYHTAINLSPSNGNCSMAWYRADSTTIETEYIIAEIKNDGATPSGYEIISPATSAGITGGFVGHYNVSRRIGCITNTIWVDGSTGTPVAYAARIDACGIVSTPEITPINSGILVHSIYPIPAGDEIKVDLSIDAEATFTFSIFDVKGQKVSEPIENKLSKGKNSFSTNISQLSSGTYFLQIKKNNGVYLTRKFVKK